MNAIRNFIMPSIFKKSRKASEPSSFIRPASSISYGDDKNVLPARITSPRGRARKLHKTSGVLTTGRLNSTIISISSTSVSSTSSASSAHSPPIANPDLVLQPDYAALVLQAYPNCDLNERPLISTSTAHGTERHSREILLDVPPSTPISQDSISMDILPAIFVSEVDSETTVMEGITYDAILTSTLHKTLGMMEGIKYLDIPATRTPPNSPAAIQEGGFGSLIGVSMAIMQDET